MRHIVGITGTLGAGKGTAVKHLHEVLGFHHFSVSAFIIEEVKRRGLEVTRDNTRIVGNDIRTTHGTDYIVGQLLQQAEATGGSAIIESIRAIGEAEFMLRQGATLIGIDADRRLRYDRIVKRGSLIDHVDYATFERQEVAELSSTDPHAQNISAVMRMAHHRLMNDGTPEELFAQLDELFLAVA